MAGGGADCIHSDAGPVETERIENLIGSGAVSRAQRRIRADAFWHLVNNQAIILRRHSEEDSGLQLCKREDQSRRRAERANFATSAAYTAVP